MQQKLIASFLFLFGLTILVFSQNPANYQFTTTTTGSFTNMDGSTTLIGSGVQRGDAQAYQTIPASDFAFVLPGNLSIGNNINVSLQGIIGIGSGVNDTRVVNTMGTHMLSAFGTPSSNNDYRMGTSSTGKVHYKVLGTAPSRIMVIEYLNMSLPASANQPGITFQVRLFENTGVIEYVYGNMAVSGDMVEPVQIGFSSATDLGLFQGAINSSENTASIGFFIWSNNSYQTGNIANLHSPTAGSQRLYRFSPAQPATPAAVSITTSSSATQTLDVSPSAGTTAYRYAFYRSTQPGGPFTQIALQSGTTFTSSGLQANTTYYYRVFAVAEGGVSNDFAATSGTTLPPANIMSTGVGGNWTEASSWVGGVVPSSNDLVTIVSGATVNINNFATSGPLTVQGTISYTANTQLQVSGNVTVADGGSISCNAGGSRALVVNDGDLINNGQLEFSQEGNAISMQIGENNHQFVTGNILGTNNSGTPANTGIIRRLTVNRLDATNPTAGTLTIQGSIIISENLNLAYGFIQNTGTLYFDNTAVAPETIAGANVGVLHFGTSQTGILGTVSVGAFATYNVTYQSTNLGGATSITAGNEIPTTGYINNLINAANVPVLVNKDLRVANQINGGSFVLGTHNLTFGKSAAQPGGFNGSQIFTTGTFTRWVGTDPIFNSGSGRFNLRSGTPTVPGSSDPPPTNRTVGIDMPTGAQSGGTISVRLLENNGQTAFTEPWFEEGRGYVRRSNTYWQITTGNGLQTDNILLNLHADGLQGAELSPWTGTAISLQNGAAPGLPEMAQQGIGYPIARRLLSSATQLNQDFYIAEFDATLPLNLLSFGGMLQGNVAKLQWRTDAEINVSHFDIERRTSNTSWQNIGRVQASGGAFVQHYHFTDHKVALGNVVYRLNMVDKDGSSRYSTEVWLKNDIVGQTQLMQNYPNPVNGITRIGYQLQQSGNVVLEISDITGRRIALLPQGLQQAGSYNVQLDSKQLKMRGGRYQYRLLVTDSNGNHIFNDSKPMMVF